MCNTYTCDINPAHQVTDIPEAFENRQLTSDILKSCMFSVISMNDSLPSPNMKKQQICNIHEPAGHSEEQTVKCLMSDFANSSSSTRLNISPSCSYRKRQRNVCNSLIPLTSISSPCNTANTSDQIWLIIFIIRPNRTTNPWSDHRSQPVTDRPILWYYRPLQRKFGWWLRTLTHNTVTISSQLLSWRLNDECLLPIFFLSAK